MASSTDRDPARTRLHAIARGAGTDDDTFAPFGFGTDTPDGDAFDANGSDSGETGDRAMSPTLRQRLEAARWDTSRRGVVAVAAVAVAAVLVAGAVVWRDRPVPEPVPPLPPVETIVEAPVIIDAASSSGAALPAVEEPAFIVVSVVGLVAKPGLVHLTPGARVADALDAAGGAVGEADLVGLNLARRVGDGDQVVVGSVPPQPVPEGSSHLGGDGNPSSDGTAPEAGNGPIKVDLNTADEAALDALPGVGPVTAAAIIAWRSRHGPFTDVAQLTEVDGIGPARLERLRELVTV